jgi:hypothetical protein
MAVDVKSAKATSAKPPPLLKGRRGSQIPTELLADMKTRIEKGEWATIDATFDTKDKASSSLVRFKKALGELVGDGVELTGRVWGENTASAPNGSQIYAAPFRFAVADKSKVG